MDQKGKRIMQKTKYVKPQSQLLDKTLAVSLGGCGTGGTPGGCGLPGYNAGTCGTGSTPNTTFRPCGTGDYALSGCSHGSHAN